MSQHMSIHDDGTLDEQAQEYISTAHVDVDRKLRMLEGTARILSDNYGVQVTFSPEGECSTTSDRMKLPYDDLVDECIIMALMGHETGHLKATDFLVGRIISRRRDVQNRELLFHICNALEDVRIEKIMEDEYRGFKYMFKAMIPYIDKRKGPKIENNELPVLQLILDMLYIKLRDYESTVYPQEVEDFVEFYLKPVGVKVYNCKCTKDVLALADEIYEILTNEKKSEVEQDKKAQEEMQKKIQKLQQQAKGNPGKGQPGGGGGGSCQKGDKCPTCGRNTKPPGSNKNQQEKQGVDGSGKGQGGGDKKEDQNQSGGGQGDQNQQEQASNQKQGNSGGGGQQQKQGSGNQGKQTPQGGGEKGDQQTQVSNGPGNEQGTSPTNDGDPNDAGNDQGNGQSTSGKDDQQPSGHADYCPDCQVPFSSKRRLYPGMRVTHFDIPGKKGTILEVNEDETEVKVIWDDETL